MKCFVERKGTNIIRYIIILKINQKGLVSIYTVLLNVTLMILKYEILETLK